ncbi:helix-turn-helix transcriptional regulator [Mangrovimicrobium sediminis]|uniref:Helix-turn-helix transcriptional regulator n=1 Tax=Mangrovimicrobium sediminis TaxID=2562682 RepID=A0A4Z0M6Z5_9GAMM|nr:LuxR C-terminal-related transcriptional regulator [Haliea sp. SAOS-164]TGD75442.1 helix-turn-helix transcriptional regulator [Haliea sp. SAOS-164]
MDGIKQLSRWNRDISQAIAALGTAQFFPALVDAVNAQVAIDYPQVWLYHRDLPPRVLFHRIPADATSTQIDEYRNGHYLGDPFYQTSMRAPKSRIYRLSRVTLGRLEHSEYYREYYCRTGTADEAVFVSRLQGGNVVNLCMMRRAEHGPFSDEEYASLYLLADPVAELLKSHSQHSEFAINNLIQPGINHQIDLAFRTFGSSLLSPREKDVLELMLRGYSTDASADKLDIAVETVRRHRKNIYRKLDVNSQTDLFSLFINAMSCLGEAAGEDPLKVYMAPR